MDPAPLKVFLAYARKDARHRNELMAHLSGVIEKGILGVWYDEKIPAGTHWREEILEHLQQAQMVLLLVSPWFRDSPSCREEVGMAMELARSGKARVIPILVGQVEYETAPYAHLQFLPGNGPVPSSDGDARNAAFAEIAAKLRNFATELRDALPGDEGNDATDIPQRLNTIAVRLADQGLPRDALEILEEAIGVSRKSLGETEDFAALLSNRGLVRQDLGDLEGARQDLERARKISEGLFGPDHPVVARRLVHLGGALLELGEEEKARRLLERAFAILEVNVVSRNPDLLLASLHLGDALKSEPQRARELLERILDEGSKEPKAAAAAHSTLGRIAFREGQFRDARNRFRQAVEIGEKSYKKGHPFVGIDLHNLGLTLRALGSLDKARDILWRALDILVPRLGADSLRVRRAEEALALVADGSISARE